MKKTLLSAALLSVAVVTSAQAAPTTISISDWSGAVSSVGVVSNAGIVSFGVSVTGGGNPGTDLRVASSLTGGSAFAHRFIEFGGATYNPGTQGAVTSFDVSMDQIYETPGFGGHGWGIGFSQGSGLQLLSMFHEFSTNNTSYTTYSNTGYTGADLISFFPSSSIDFSASGGEIQLGLYIFTGNGGSPTRFDQTRYDNFSITFNSPDPVPAPGALLLLGLGLIGLGAARRKSV